jgi:hypothetical protein
LVESVEKVLPTAGAVERAGADHGGPVLLDLRDPVAGVGEGLAPASGWDDQRRPAV